MVFINNDGSITSNAAAPNQDGPSADDFAMKVYTRFMMTTVLTMNDPNAAAARVLSEAFDKVRADETADEYT